MVVIYLEKIKDKFMKEKVDIQAQLKELLIILKEDTEFIKLLEQDNDDHFEAFTPRTVNSFHKKKINELKEEQKLIETRIDEFQSRLERLEKEINEVNEVIQVAKESGL